MKKPTFRTSNEVSNEQGEIYHEISSLKKVVTDDRPVHIGGKASLIYPNNLILKVAILMLSKLMLLKFVFFLYDHLQVGSYRNIYCDTGKTKLYSHNLTLIKIPSALRPPKPEKHQIQHLKKSSKVFSIQFLNQTWSILGNDNGSSILSLKIRLRTRDVLVK